MIKGEYNENDIIEIQVYAGTNLATELSAQVLEGTPRVVVGGKPGSPGIGNYEYRDSGGETVVDQAIWNFPDLLWFDEGVWEILDDDSSNSISITEESDGTTTLPSELLEDDTPETNTGVPLEEGSEDQLLVAESHYLRGLWEMHPMWGELNSLDDLANALRGAASEATTPSTTSEATTPSTTTTASTTTVASTTTEPPQP